MHRQAGGDDRREEAVGCRLGVVISDSGRWGELAAGRGCG